MYENAKRDLYQRAGRQLDELLAGVDDPVAVMSTTVAVLFEALPAASWAGFYRVVAPQLLRIGPYQGPVGCLEIPFSRGVCGAAARTLETQVVADVHEFPDHIACDPRSRSEIVLPVFSSDRELVAVLDIDSRSEAAFDDTDRRELEAIVRKIGSHLSPAVTARESAGR